MARLALGSKPVVGSSRKSSSGELTSERASLFSVFARLRGLSKLVLADSSSRTSFRISSGLTLMLKGQRSSIMASLGVVFSKNVNSWGMTPIFL